jgi:Fe-Mn family superoxide dismutase
MKWNFSYLSLCILPLLPLKADIQPKDYSNLIGKMPKLNPELIEVHLKLYQGYVTQVNLLSNKLKEKDLDTFTYQSIKRRYAWELDGVLLHELYFDNLGGKGVIDPKSDIYKAIEKNFGSFDNFISDFKKTILVRGIGWVVLYYDSKKNELYNAWIEEHDKGPIIEAKPLLVIDVWEHAYISQFKTDRTKYADVIFQYIDWNVVSKRYQNKD